MDHTTDLVIISDFLSREDLQMALVDTDITLAPLTSQDKLRGALDPNVLAAVISGVASVAVPIVTLITTKILERFKEKKKDGLLIIKSENTEIHIPFTATDEEISKKLQIVESMTKVEHLMITSNKNE